MFVLRGSDFKLIDFFFESYTAGETPTVVRHIIKREKCTRTTVQKAPQHPKERKDNRKTSKKLGERAITVHC